MTGEGASKAQLRASVLAARRATSARERARSAVRMTRLLLGLPELAAARCVAAHISFGTEPSTAELLWKLDSRNVRVLVPVLRDDLDLDWAIYDPAQIVPQAERGPPRPPGPLLGSEALAAADVVVAPALAVGPSGMRLGRGGGSYDRALARVPSACAVVALVYDGELLPDVPAEPHDLPVDAAVTPSGVHRFARPPGPP